MNQSIIAEIVQLENLHWAWEKAKSFYQKHEHWYDQLELASFSANYENELKKIVQEIQQENYTLTPLQPIFFPKGQDEKGEAQSRQMFWVAVRDQVVWLAVMNIIGRYYDKQMPFWSYGNRLYISMFPKEKKKNGKIVWGYGPYRNTITNAYRSFQQSWPRFRKDIYLTAKLMTSNKGTLNKEEKDNIEENNHLNKTHKVRYKEPNYWKKNQSDLYWCSIDLTKFYPSAKVEIIEQNFENFGVKLKEDYTDSHKLKNLISLLLKFKISYHGLEHLDDKYFEIIGLGAKDLIYNGIPTGLFSAGFLSNIAMLKVDIEANILIEEKKEIAHFRFVDDHTFLSTNVDNLVNWVEQYKSLLETHFKDSSGRSCIEINWKKTKPDEYAEYLDKKFNPKSGQTNDKLEELREKAIHEMRLDPHYPSTLMNLTLEKMSMINHTPFDLLDEAEGKRVLGDLEHLLITDFPDDEIRKDTRVSYAASRLALLTSRKNHDFSEIYLKKRKLFEQLNKDKNDKKVEQLNKDLVQTKNDLEQNIQEDRRRIFKLLIYAIHKHPEKLRLWKNALLFCEKNGFSEIEIKDTHYKNELITIWDLVNEMKESKIINEVSNIYIKTFFYDLLIHSLIRVYKLLQNTQLSYREINRKCSYFRQILSPNFLKKILPGSDQTYYFKQSQEYLKTTIGTILFLLNELNDNIVNKLKLENSDTLINNFELIDWNNSPIEYLENKNLDADKIIWSLIEKFSSQNENNHLSIAKLYLESANIENNFAFTAVAALYPDSINDNGIKKLLQQKNNSYLAFSWWYKVFENRSVNFSKDVIVNIDALKYVKYMKAKESQTFILDFLKNKDFQQDKELKILGYIKKILDRYCNVNIEDVKSPDKIFTSFPYNIVLQKDDEINMIDCEEIIDNRYFSDFIESTHQEERKIFAIGILMFQLVTQTRWLPNAMFLPSTQLFNLGYFLSKLEKYPISSYTAEIIESSLSKRKRETRKFKSYPFEYDSDFDNDEKDELIFYTVYELRDAINNAIRLVEENKYVFKDNARYLVPISLNKIKKDIFQQGESND
ncbi:MAG: RNA-directed DNA polymerase [Sulfurospirillaceae bacterium]|nr:RNA-directed DNA polymerase [Sulfurospirillaceae bacterium]MDD2825634.1 RNA-directed DNA polymerase [Sulfurospirillaceae bacterium]